MFFDDIATLVGCPGNSLGFAPALAFAQHHSAPAEVVCVGKIFVVVGVEGEIRCNHIVRFYFPFATCCALQLLRPGVVITPHG